MLVDLFLLDLLVFSLMPLCQGRMRRVIYSLVCTVYFIGLDRFLSGYTECCLFCFCQPFLLGVDLEVFVNVHILLIPSQEELDSDICW